MQLSLQNDVNFNGPEAAEILVNDIKFLETVKKQKLEMINILEAKIIQDEDEYLDLSLHRHGNVFNAWKEIKQGRFGATDNKPSVVMGANRMGAGLPKHRQKALQKEKDKEKIYKGVIMEDKEHRERMDREYKINYIDLASKKEQGGRISTRGTRGERKTNSNQNESS